MQNKVNFSLNRAQGGMNNKKRKSDKMYRGSNMSAQLLLVSWNKMIKCEAWPRILSFFLSSLMQ